MEISKNFKKHNEITYSECLESQDYLFGEKIVKEKWDFTYAEDWNVYQFGELYEEDEITRMLDFVAIAYCEIKYGKLTERMKGEMSLDIPVWDSGEVDKFLDDDEKKLIYEHLAIIKKYLKDNPLK